MKMVTEKQLDDIYDAALSVLEKTGFKMTHTRAVALCKAAGCKIEDDRVRVPRQVVEQSLRLAPKGFMVYDRLGNPALDLTGRNSYYGCSTGSPQTLDAATGEIRAATFRDLEIGALVSDALPNIDWVMPFGTTQDTPGHAAFLYDFEACVSNTTLPLMFLSEGTEDTLYIQQMAAACVGGKEKLREKPFLMAYPEPITPLFYPDKVVGRSFLAADWGIPQCPGTSQIIGATSPVTLAGAIVVWLALAGAIVVWLAEALMSITVLQLYKPGSKVFLSGNFGLFDMATTVSAIASPETCMCLAVEAQMGQRLGLPTWGLAGASDSMMLDGQAGAESAFSILSQGLLRGININEDTLATEAIDRVGPGGNFLQSRHTFEHFKNETWFPKLMERNYHDNWVEKGKPSTQDRVREKLAKIIDTHQPIPLGNHERSELERLRKEGEEVLKRNLG